MARLYRNCQLFQRAGGVHAANQIDNLVGITHFVVVPGDQLHEMLVEHDTGTGVEHGSSLFIEEVGGNHSVFGVTENALELAFGGFLHGSLDLFVGSSLFEAAGQVNHRNVSRGDAQ